METSEECSKTYIIFLGLPIGDAEVVLWLSCNSRLWGLGPTAVFACAAAVFLYREVDATMPAAIRERSEHSVVVRVMENCMMITMVLGMLALMIHLWVCCTQFLHFYLEAIINDYPNLLIDMTAYGLLGGCLSGCKMDSMTRFLRTQQENIHVTACWFLALCYADYVRRHHCDDLQIPYIYEWKTQLQTATVEGVRRTAQHVSSVIDTINERVRHLSDELVRQLGGPQTPPPGPRPEQHPFTTPPMTPS